MIRTLTSEEITKFKRLVEEENKSPEVAAESISVKPGSIRNILRESGYRVRVIRIVEQISAVPIAAQK